MEKYQFYLELVKVIIWPCLIFFLSGFFLLISWQEIKKRFKFLTRVDYRNGILEFENTPLGAMKRNEQDSQITKKVLPLDDAFASPIVVNEKKTIVGQLKNLQRSSEEVNDLLVHHLAHQHVYNHYWWITNNIFLEQIQILKQLNNGVPLIKEQIRSFYENYTKVPSSLMPHRTFDQFIAWLSNTQLVVENADAHYFITDKGRDYLKFLISMGHPVMS